ncbi:hypothetical protein PSPO01_11109 [Paraphaeosphaeria sporulosa]
MIGRKIEAARAEGLYEQLRVKLGIHNEDTWNMDETRKALGICANTRVLAGSQKKKAYY